MLQKPFFKVFAVTFIIIVMMNAFYNISVEHPSKFVAPSLLTSNQILEDLKTLGDFV